MNEQKKQYSPIHIAFPGKRPDEQVILLMRRHWIVVLKFVSFFVTLALIPPALFLVLHLVLAFDFPTTGVLYVLMIMGFSAYYLFIWVFFFYDFVDYHLDIWILTDQRIVSIEQKGWFNRVISELSVSKVQDVTSEVKGLIPTFLNYGNVHVQTAGAENKFLFRQIPAPQQVAQIIMHVHNSAEEQLVYKNPD